MGEAVELGGKRVAIVQSNYIPWKGYFDLIASVDEFILYDDVQFTRRDWRNSNRIKTPQGVHWLTVPVRVRGRYHQTIRDTEIDGDGWASHHWQVLAQNYRKAPCFNQMAMVFEPLFLEQRFTHLSLLNRALIEAICGVLRIGTKISDCSSYLLIEGRSERLADLCLQAGGAEYVSGPAARCYLEAEPFSARGLHFSFYEYGRYPAYPQLWGEFVHEVSIMDLLFNCGHDARRFMMLGDSSSDSGGSFSGRSDESDQT